MHLLNASSALIEYFHSSHSAPPYAILSHTWTHTEVTFQDLRDLKQAGSTKTWPKLHFACQQALRDGLQYVWIDTCCIDKSSSAELQEAINSMFAWYASSTFCYVYLADLPARSTQLKDGDESVGSKNMEALRKCRWFTRGWTLQELIAPHRLRFYDSDWNLVASLHEVAWNVSQRTGVPVDVLSKFRSYKSYSVAERMSWASDRQTTRPEDRAYSLLGLFDIHMPLLYGEGFRAFERLQIQILNDNQDHSILLWNRYRSIGSDYNASHLAPSPDHFEKNTGVTCCSSSPFDGYLSLRGDNLSLQMPVLPVDIIQSGAIAALLNCHLQNSPTRVIAWLLKPYEGLGPAENRFVEMKLDPAQSIILRQDMDARPYHAQPIASNSCFVHIAEVVARYATKQRIHIWRPRTWRILPPPGDYRLSVKIEIADEMRLRVIAVQPASWWNTRTQILTQPDGELPEDVAIEFSSSCGSQAVIVFFNSEDPMFVYDKSLGDLDLGALQASYDEDTSMESEEGHSIQFDLGHTTHGWCFKVSLSEANAHR